MGIGRLKRHVAPFAILAAAAAVTLVGLPASGAAARSASTEFHADRALKLNRLAPARVYRTRAVIKAPAVRRPLTSSEPPSAKADSSTVSPTANAPVVGSASAVNPTLVTAPSPPEPYTVPADATVVTDTAQLSAALAAGDPAIELADGSYATDGYFTDWNSSSLYAEQLDGAILSSGLMIGSNSTGSGGATVQGLAFNLSNPAESFQDSELNLWGQAANDTSVLDCTFQGNGQIGVGLLAMNPNGLIARRLTFTDFTDEGIRADTNTPVAYGQPTALINAISDITVNGVSQPTPGSSAGTAEAGLWIGQPVTNGVTRIAISNCAWSGIETADNAWNTTYSNLSINMAGPDAAAGVAVYLEHYSIDDTFTKFAVSGAKEGFNAEWNDGTPGGQAARQDTIENGTINANGWTLGGNEAGIFLDQGTSDTTITNITFANQNWAAVGAYQTTGTTVSDDSYSLPSGAAPYTLSHI